VNGSLPVMVVTGFLGSGKTTMISGLLRHPGLEDTAVLVNEFGEIGLDHLLVEHVDESTILIGQGCLCCAVREDLVVALMDLLERREAGAVPGFRRLVVETTGLADPAPILHTLLADDRLRGRCHIAGIITTVDVLHARDQLEREPECLRQAAVADRLLLTKADLATLDQMSTLQALLHSLNPAAPKVLAVGGLVDPALLFDAGLYNPATKSLDVQNWLKAEAYDGSHEHEHHHHHHEVNRHDAHIKALCLTIDAPLPADKFEAWLDLLLAFQGPNLLRIKGIINVAELDGPVVIHGVQHIFHPPVTLERWPSSDRRSRIVFITRDLAESVLRDTLRVVTGFGGPEAASTDTPVDTDVSIEEAT